MGASIPLSVMDSALSQELILAGLMRTHQGKVRDTFEIPDHDDLLLQIATDRISIFDFVLPAIVQDKGKILTALTVFWLKGPLSIFMNHLVASGSEIDQYLPVKFRGNSDLQSRALVVKKLDIIPVECVVRGYLTGSGWSSYEKDGTVCGIQLPSGLKNGSQLPEPIFTPTTKAESGHDKHMDAESVVHDYGKWIKSIPLAIYLAASKHARAHGIIIADFKLEFGTDGMLADEVVTPDSSRFWHKTDWGTALAEGYTPKSQDKEFVRDWGKGVKTPFVYQRGSFTDVEIISPYVTGIQNLDPENSDHLKFVGDLTVPKEVLVETAVRYREIFQQLAKLTLRDFQLQKLGIKG